ncbi:MAG: ribonuclease H-like domain-containing protein [Candidatus Woesearchaeota archaeon]
MLRNTFCHLPRIGENTEITLWKQGIQTWNDFIQTNNVPRIGANKKHALNKLLREANQALLNNQATYFCALPSNQHWRVWEEFNTKAAFIDIETNYRQNITVLGISDGERVWQFVRDHNMNAQDIRRVLKQFDVLVTFNGACFDLPIIKRYFHDVIPEVPHIDLRFAAAKIGLTGGLKHIEQTLGIARTEDTQELSGADALTLWDTYRSTQEKKYLDILLEYNAEDILNLKPLTDYIYKHLREEHKKHFRQA